MAGADLGLLDLQGGEAYLDHAALLYYFDCQVVIVILLVIVLSDLLLAVHVC